MSLALIATVAVMALTMGAFEHYADASFYAQLPSSAQKEFDFLDANDMLLTPRGQHLYARYETGKSLSLKRWALTAGLLVCLPFGLITGLLVSRYISAPMMSIAHAARRISAADFSVRATTTQRGGLANVVRDFNTMADALESLERDRKMTAAAISHELRTPLAVLQASLHALADGVIQPTPTSFLSMVGQVQHLSRLIDDVHTLSIADAGKLALHRERLNLGDLTADVLEQFRPRLENVGVAGTMDCPATPQFVWADSGRMRQVLGNLIENVARHAHSGQRLHLALTRAGADVVIAVSDWGEGLPSTMQNHMFERFYRPDSSRNRATGGSGLGLAIVKALMLAQDGSVHVDSRRGEGCTFYLTLPAHEEDSISSCP
ncbi:MAG: HAMP domain-containing protein [Alcaligenaceae bacterium]|nr:MAG: HAMP domain-containing protein [Alcaligenaceae bacterium]